MVNQRRSDILKRKLKGKRILARYEENFKDFSKRNLINLEESDSIVTKISKIFSNCPEEIEFLDTDKSFIESNLLRGQFILSHESSLAYIFTDDFEFCGLNLVSEKETFVHCLKIAKHDFNNTCFFVDRSFTYSFVINYYGQDHADYPDLFEIKRHLNCNSE